MEFQLSDFVQQIYRTTSAATICVLWALNTQKMRLQLELVPDPAGGALQSSSEPPVIFQGAASQLK